MTQLNTSTLERFALPGMEILLKLERVAVDHYSPSPEEERGRYWVEVTSDDGNRRVVTIEELFGLFGTVDPAALASDTAVAARISAVMLGLGRVVNDNELYKYLESRYGIQLSSQVPRLEGTHLKFLALKAQHLHETPGLRNVDIDIPSAHVTVTPIPEQ